MKRASIQQFYDNLMSLTDEVQEVINEAVNNERASDAEVLSVLSTLLVKGAIRAGLSLEEFLDGAEINYILASCHETAPDESIH
tara:strand:+ start:1588 stop:1839 length:252 start_codon:yes stop_codon:yes gene_type:complete